MENWVKKGDHYKVDKKVPDLPFFKMTEAKKREREKKRNKIKLPKHCLTCLDTGSKNKARVL